MCEEKVRTESEVYATAVGLLARREHSVKELATKLHSRGIETGLIESVMARLIEERLQSDERFAEVYLRQRSAKGYGPLRIANELRERGVADRLISAQLRQAEDEGEIDWLAQAAAAYAKKYGGGPVEEMRERAKRMRFLQYRGFSHEQIAAVIKGA